MGKNLLVGRLLWSLLQSQGRGQNKCGKGVEGDHLAMVDAVLIMGVLDLVHYPGHAPPVIHRVQEVDTDQGPTLLLQDGEVTILFPLVEGMQITLNHPEVLLVSEMVREVDKYILPVMIMLMTTITMEMEMEMEMDIMTSLHLKGRMHELIGGHLLVEHQDLLRGPDPALLMRPPDMVDDFSLGKHGSR